MSHASEVFYRFEVGESSLAYPLALGMTRALNLRGMTDFDCIIPIPLSPDRDRAGNIHRTRLLARELGRLLRVRTSEALGLTRSISKRRLLRRGTRGGAFADRYFARLRVVQPLRGARHILLVDDVCTRGTTLNCAAERLCELDEDLIISAATAGQMALRFAVAIAEPPPAVAAA